MQRQSERRCSARQRCLRQRNIWRQIAQVPTAELYVLAELILTAFCKLTHTLGLHMDTLYNLHATVKRFSPDMLVAIINAAPCLQHVSHCVETVSNVDCAASHCA